MKPEEFTEAEFRDKQAEVTKLLLSSYEPLRCDRPQAFLLGGQSGAGKTALHDALRKQTPGHPISIIGDDYRKIHPRFQELQRLHGDKAVDYTALWAGRMTEALIEALSAIGYNLIIEGTLRTAAVPMKTATLLRSRGYAVSLALMAVKPEISLVSCQLRYEQMRVAGTTPRATDLAHHNKIIQDIVENLAALEESGLFDKTYLYTQAQQCIFPPKGFTGTASEALQEKLFGPWSPEEIRHLAILQQKLENLKARPRNSNMAKGQATP